jgi:hypothetical protein
VANIRQPSNGQKISEKDVVVYTDVSDDAGLARVELWVNGALNRTLYQPPYTFTVPAAGLGYGEHSLQVRAHDVAGNVGASQKATIKIGNAGDVTNPVVKLKSANSNGIITGTAELTAIASDNSGVVKKVELYRSGELIDTDRVAPFIFSVNTKNIPNGSYNFQARAYDEAGNVASSTLNLRVHNEVDSTPPTVTLNQPSNNQVIGKNAQMKVIARAHDNKGVAKMILILDSRVLEVCYNVQLCEASVGVNMGTGQHTVFAWAYDEAGNATRDVAYITKKK